MFLASKNCFLDKETVLFVELTVICYCLKCKQTRVINPPTRSADAVQIAQIVVRMFQLRRVSSKQRCRTRISEVFSSISFVFFYAIAIISVVKVP